MARILVSLALLIPVVALAASPFGKKPAGDGSKDAAIDFDAASCVVDQKKGSVVCKDVVIKRGDIKAQADHANGGGLDFDNSQWTFEGNVHIHTESRGDLRSDQAVVEFKNNQIVKATVTGTPAEFEQKRAESDQMARGHAGEIVYDVTDGTVVLSRGTSPDAKDAWLSDGGQYEITAPRVVYDIRDQKFQATQQSGTDSRVHFSIPPRPKEPEKKP